MSLSHLSLFSGIGGIDLAAHWAGFETAAFVERDPFCQSVLAKNFPGTPIYDDITTFDPEPFRGRIDLISGGFPCQDISAANPYGKGLEGERSGLWFKMLEVIEQVRPTWVLAENVRNLVKMGIDTCFLGMEAIGYEVTALIVPACGVGAVHRRERVFIVAYASGQRRQQEPRSPHGYEETHGEEYNHVASSLEQNSPVNSDPNSERRDDGFYYRRERHVSQDINWIPAESEPKRDRRVGRVGKVRDFAYRTITTGDWRTWGIKPAIRRSDDGVSRKVDASRLKALGNAVCPHQVFPILESIALFEHRHAPATIKVGG